jgi:hypothetical protein
MKHQKAAVVVMTLRVHPSARVSRVMATLQRVERMLRLLANLIAQPVSQANVPSSRTSRTGLDPTFHRLGVALRGDLVDHYYPTEIVEAAP